MCCGSDGVAHTSADGYADSESDGGTDGVADVITDCRAKRSSNGSADCVADEHVGLPDEPARCACRAGWGT